MHLRLNRPFLPDATHKNGFEEAVEAAFQPTQPYCGIEFSLPRFRYSSDDNFSGTVEYRHGGGEGAFELQISYRLDPILEPVDLTLQEQSYFTKADEECGVPQLFGLDPYEMIGSRPGPIDAASRAMTRLRS